MFLKSVVDMVWYFCNMLSSSILKDIKLSLLFLSPPSFLNVLIYQLILGNIKTNGLITSSESSIKYLELFSVSALRQLWDNYIISINIPDFYWLCCTKNFSFTTFALLNLNIIIVSKKTLLQLFFSYLIRTFFSEFSQVIVVMILIFIKNWFNEHF